MFSTDAAVQIEATARIRRLLSKETNPPIEQVIRAGLVPRFIEFLGAENSQLQVRYAVVLLIGS